MLRDTTTSAMPADGALVRGRRQLGEFELIFCTDGTFRLDGGAMFGVVPKTLWQKRLPADEQNCVRLGLNTVVARRGGDVLVIETGLGNKQSPKMREILANHELLPASLAAAGVRVDEVTHVITTHLHFDHCGWNTVLHEDGSVTPMFKNAKYFAAAGELAHGRLQLERDRVSYQGPNYDPLIASGQLTLLDPGGSAGKSMEGMEIQVSPEIMPGVWVEGFPGHTPWMLGVHLESGGEHACYVGDLFPTRHHLDPTWVMGYDLDPLGCIEMRKKVLKRAIEEQWLVLFTHDHEVPAAYLQWNEKGKPEVKSL